jgi:uncharacterized protein (TIGR03067 family)
MMQKYWLIVVFVVVAGLMTGCGGGDKEKIVGTWVIESMEVAGKSLPNPDKEAKMVITADKITAKGKDEDEHTYTLDPSKNPKHIDMTATKGKEKGKTMKGIYTLEGDTFKFAFIFAKEDRPTEFKTDEKNGVMIMTLKREKAK